MTLLFLRPLKRLILVAPSLSSHNDRFRVCKVDALSKYAVISIADTESNRQSVNLTTSSQVVYTLISPVNYQNANHEQYSQGLNKHIIEYCSSLDLQ